MSSDADKESAKSTPGRPSRSLDSLRCSRGYVVLAGPASRPERVRICPMDIATTWVRVPGAEPLRAYEQEGGGA